MVNKKPWNTQGGVDRATGTMKIADDTLSTSAVDSEVTNKS
jgi:hypothetical protein